MWEATEVTHPLRASLPALRALAGWPFWPSYQAGSPGPGSATVRLPKRSQSEGDGLTADLNHPLSLKARMMRGWPPTRLRDSDAVLMSMMDTWRLGIPEYALMSRPSPVASHPVRNASLIGWGVGPLGELEPQTSVNELAGGIEVPGVTSGLSDYV